MVTCNFSTELFLVRLLFGGDLLSRSIDARYSSKTLRFWKRAEGEGQLLYELTSVPYGSLRLCYLASIIGV